MKMVGSLKPIVRSIRNRSSSSQKTKVAILGWYGNGNVGDEALLHGMLDAIRTAESTIAPHVLSDDPGETTRTTGVLSSDRGMKYHPLRRPVYQATTILRQDALVLGGGGLIKDYGRDSGNIRRWLGPVLLAQRLRKPTMVYAVGVDEIRFEDSRHYIRNVLNRCDAITVRDDWSRQDLLDIGVSGEILVTTDPAILIGRQITRGDRHSPGHNPRIAVCPRHWFAKASVVDHPELVDRIESELAAVLDVLVEEEQVTVNFVPFRKVSTDDDSKVCERIQQKMRFRESTTMFDVPGSPLKVAEHFAECEMVIGTRLHSLILAASVGTPFFGLDYMPKVGRFTEHIGLPTLRVDLEEGAMPGILLAQLMSAYSLRQQIRCHLEQALPPHQELAMLNGQLLAALVQKDDERWDETRKHILRVHNILKGCVWNPESHQKAPSP